MTIRAIDTETTGTDPEDDAVIEIASIDIIKRVDGTLDITNGVQTLVNPGRPIPPESSAVHHLIDADVEKASPLRDVIERFTGAQAYVAHRCSFEQSFLGEHLGEATWICTYKCALRVWPNAPGYSNQTLRYWLGLVRPFNWDRDDLPAHRALSDAIVTAGIFAELLKHAKWSALVQWSSEPAFHTVLSFGKHRGKRYDEVPADYLQWICDKSDLDEDTKFSAMAWLPKVTAKEEAQRAATA